MYYSPRMSIGGSAARYTLWMSDTMISCFMLYGTGGTQRITFTTGVSVATLSNTMSYNVPSIASQTNEWLYSGAPCAASGGTCTCNNGIVSMLASDNNFMTNIVASTTSVPCTGTGVQKCQCFTSPFTGGQPITLFGTNFGTSDQSSTISVSGGSAASVNMWTSDTSVQLQNPPCPLCTATSLANTIMLYTNGLASNQFSVTPSLTDYGPCMVGTYSNTGKVPCTACQSTHYCATGSTADTTLCAAGYYCPTAASQTICETGYYCPNAGLIAQTLCAAGSYCATTLSQLICSSGNYCAAGTTVNTITCAAGFFCNSPTTQVACQSTHYCAAGTTTDTTLCPVGFYCPTPSSKMICGIGHYCAAGTITDITQCAAGSFCATPATQVICNSGFGSLSGATVCYSMCLASAGSFCPPAATSPIPCTPGSFCSTSGLSAPDGVCTTNGTYCPPGSSSPMPCSAGTYCQNTSSQQICVPGYYCPPNSTAQTPCPSNTYSIYTSRTVCPAHRSKCKRS